MKCKDIIELIKGETLTKGNDMDFEIECAFGSDLMSDVLTFVSDKFMLITGLNNPQVIRTAEMLDISLVVFTRGKVPDDEIVKMASEKGIIVVVVKDSMFNVCGQLYAAGIKGVTLGGN